MKKIILKSLFASSLAVTAFTGCAGTAQPEVEAAYVDPEFKGAPKWVTMPYVEGYIAEIGSAQKNAGNDRGFQREEAMANARDNLAKQISSKVSNMFKKFSSSTGSGDSATFDKSSESVSKQIASETLSGTKQKDAWISRSGTLYILMVIDTKSVTDMMEKATKTSFKNDKALYQKFLASKAQGSLDKELEKAGK